MKIMPKECPYCKSEELYDPNQKTGGSPYCDDCGENIDKIDCPKATKKLLTLLARQAFKKECVVTIINGEEETKNVAEPGDYIVSGIKGEEYVIKKEKLEERYNIETINNKHNIYGFIYIHTKPVIIECRESNVNFRFTASWGEEMICNKGDFVVYENDKLSYRIEREVFFKTYELNEQ